LSEVEVERNALRTEFDAERAALKRERRRLAQGAERQRQQLAEDREAAEERKKLRERNEQLEEEMKEKDKRWQRTVDRLQRQINDITRKNQELQEEVKRANQQAQQALLSQEEHRRSSSASALGRRGRSSTGMPKASVHTSSHTASVEETASWKTVHPGRSNLLSGHPHVPCSRADTTKLPLNSLLRSGNTTPRRADHKSDRHGKSPLLNERGRGDQEEDLRHNASASDNTPGADVPLLRHEEVQDVRALDGRIERSFKDGHREVEFANGLRKVMWPDGHITVLFLNGDRKEIHPDEVVVYHYKATQAMQTTLPDGTELYQFVDGQFERHRPDGTKEIQFPNGTSKWIFTDGSEEVRFADGTVRQTPASTQPAQC